MRHASCPSGFAARSRSRRERHRLTHRPDRHWRVAPRRVGRPTACRSGTAGARIARASGWGGLADGIADLAGLLVGLPCGATACRLLAGAVDVAGVDVARVDIRVAVDVDVGVPAAAIVVAAPRRADRRAPDHPGGHRGTGRIRVVVRRVGRRVVTVNRRRAVHDHGRRVVLRDVDHLRIGRLDDDGLLLDLHHLLVVGLEVARRLRLAAKGLNRLDHGALVGDDRLAEGTRPVEVGAHLLHHVGIVEQRFDRVVPLFVDGKLGIGLPLVEIAIRLNELQRIGRRRQDDRDQIVRIKRDRAHQLGEFLGRWRGRSAPRSRRRLRDGMHREDEQYDSRQHFKPGRGGCGVPRRVVRNRFIMRAPSPVQSLRIPAIHARSIRSYRWLARQCTRNPRARRAARLGKGFLRLLRGDPRLSLRVPGGSRIPPSVLAARRSAKSVAPAVRRAVDERQ